MMCGGIRGGAQGDVASGKKYGCGMPRPVTGGAEGFEPGMYGADPNNPVVAAAQAAANSISNNMAAQNFCFTPEVAGLQANKPQGAGDPQAQWKCSCGWKNRPMNTKCGGGRAGFGCGLERTIAEQVGEAAKTVGSYSTPSWERLQAPEVAQAAPPMPEPMPAYDPYMMGMPPMEGMPPGPDGPPGHMGMGMNGHHMGMMYDPMMWGGQMPYGGHMPPGGPPGGPGGPGGPPNHNYGPPDHGSPADLKRQQFELEMQLQQQQMQLQQNLQMQMMHQGPPGPMGAGKRQGMGDWKCPCGWRARLFFF